MPNPPSTPTDEQFHEAMIAMCLAIEKVADALVCEHREFSEANARHAKELVNDAHKHMVYETDEDPGQPWPEATEDE